MKAEGEVGAEFLAPYLDKIHKILGEEKVKLLMPPLLILLTRALQQHQTPATSRVFGSEREALRHEIDDLNCVFRRLSCLFESERDSLRRQRVRREVHEEGFVEIDDDAIISSSPDNGFYVQAWHWIDEDNER